MALFLMVNLTKNHSDVFMYVRYISFTYSLMGVYLACQGLFSSLDSSITVFLFSIVLGLLMAIYMMFGSKM
ncbi:hypothetical protein IscW_ISCW018742 [Ixodes scapularis]|uniref:Uncharacterized protein n=1 Tax=Ixodes scapularis TaxID=6945 RepID=B7PLA3_IXOSC|nr:hypothetical protein IscW_ISCW018742 [Ixodes scapularis]|eukprot:XP_002434551.1 hypothetical protein IscW_ISCW018742 [Ixodes scapularis]